MENGAKTLLKTATSFDIVAAVDNILFAKCTHTIINGVLLSMAGDLNHSEKIVTG